MIGEIERDPHLRGKVIPLSFHVDYWNHLGWRDPYSSQEWSLRQGAYVHVLKLGSAYTPQAVVDGERQMVGSDRRAVYDAIARASNESPVAHVAIVRGEAHGSTPRELNLLALIVEDDKPTVVKSGENGGRTLRNEAIVRKVTRFVRVGGAFTQPIGAANVVLLQDPKTLKIYAAAATPR